MAFQAHSSIHSLVPLLYASNGDLQSAVDQATDVLAKGVQGLEDTVKRFADGEGTFDAVSKGQIRDFIKGCRFYCSGNLNWRSVDQALVRQPRGVRSEGVKADQVLSIVFRPGVMASTVKT